MTINEAMDAISVNLMNVLNKIEKIELKKGLKEKERIKINIMKSQIIGCSELILGIYSNKESLNQKYIAYEIETAQSLCIKIIKELKKIN